jgi:hypothetical protein
MPMTRVLEQYGHQPKNGKWKSFTCPFCHKKSKAGIFAHEGVDMFKCQSTACPTGARAMEAVGYIAYVSGRSREDAFVDYLKLAGVWRERGQLRNETARTPEPPKGGTTNLRPPESDNLPDSQESSSREQPEDSNSGAETENVPQGERLRAYLEVDAESESAQASPASSLPPATEDGEASSSTISDERCREALCEFYGRLNLTEADELALFERRAISSKVSAALGFKSNSLENRGILQALAQQFPMAVLVEAGLWSRSEKGFKPNKQFYGWGLKGKNVEIKKDEDEEWGWTQPILIPYFNEDGDLFYLRPHKGGVKGQPAHLYVPRPAGQPDERKRRGVLITEGEFKAAAALAFLPEGWGVCSLPGIQMAKNYFINAELEDWLESVWAKQVVIVYDNEEKGDPALPGYKENPAKRHDPKIWARVLAYRLHERLHLRTQIAMLPDELRDERGKADWDGCLARIGKLIPEPPKGGTPNLPNPHLADGAA